MKDEEFNDLTPLEINIKAGYYYKKKIESFYWDLQKICMTCNVHLQKKDRLTPKKMIESVKKQKELNAMSPDDKVEMLKGVFGNKGTTDDFIAKKKANKTINELIRQGKLSKVN